MKFSSGPSPIWAELAGLSPAEPAPKEHQLLTPREAAELLRLNYRTVLDLITMGELRASRIGRVFRINRNEISRYLRSTEVQSPWPKT
ncbi:MAG: helix-turn-helix domain-containing protein, partial [Candidatus Marinimicrobia bacterium]|nr:helix-turn-helix domain-containing protein [Candidatus Neomarinimicrobiota bacterium]